MEIRGVLYKGLMIIHIAVAMKQNFYTISL